MKADVKTKTPSRADRQHANARKRRYRQRQAAGICIAPTPVSNEIIALLINTHWLAVTDSEDARRIGDAISRMLADAAKR